MGHVTNQPESLSRQTSRGGGRHTKVKGGTAPFQFFIPKLDAFRKNKNNKMKVQQLCYPNHFSFFVLEKREILYELPPVFYYGVDIGQG